ncbi:hypothetical protein Daesc_006150 [Daldinia eschscholtzii]|uniref:Uncharacterized protein n=1 Tax=Daldinia eschscholtzii TaxID=292717 RepID=A0AAX6MFZ5_9PEZI
MAPFVTSAPQGIVWEKGMRLGPGAPHGFDFKERIDDVRLMRGTGTIEDPLVIWPAPGPHIASNESKRQTIMQIVSQTTTDCGLSHAWIAADAHPTSTIGWENGRRKTLRDDYHVTVRMGSDKKTCNLHGHIYLVCEGHDLRRPIVRAMRNDERGIVGGSSPQLLVWGPYESSWPRARTSLPQPPYQVKPGSILEYQTVINPIHTGGLNRKR